MRARSGGLFFLALVVLVQPWGLTAADTKHDLVANPAGFLAGALHAYTDTFTLGQLQNQAYGFLFPQGLFFLLADPLPDWIAQRAWWFLVLSVGFLGFFRLVRTVLPAAPDYAALVGGVLFALSPRTLTTLGAISSETWPVMLAPWVLLPFLKPVTLGWRDAAPSVVAVACMGAVNATATLAACLPAGLILLWRRAGKASLVWLAGCAAVSAWWIIPLLILGRYAPPFTEFIESAHVTTRWLNLAEILRGTTSWAPFVDTERIAGNELATEPVFVLFTAGVAALGLVGLSRLPRVWSFMLLVGVAVLGTHAAWYLDALDGPLAALRNVHKFDPLVRIPLVLGVAAIAARVRLPRTLSLGRRQAAGLLVCLVVMGATAPAWAGRLLPKGAYEEVPAYWHEAASFMNSLDTRVLIYPPASFARQDWGWTRDEPAQPLLDVPWAVRDAIPLIPPEAIRGLDGAMAQISRDPASAPLVLQRLGIGAVAVRHDLISGSSVHIPGEVHTFGEVDVVVFDPDLSMNLAPADPPRVAGGGESLALLSGPHELVSANADIVTDTPSLRDRNYGTLTGPVSAPLAPSDPSSVRNRLRDYPSAGPLTQVVEHDGRVTASSSAADASAFGGANPARSLTAAVDGENSTAWWPAPGDSGWLELHSDSTWTSPKLRLMTTGTTEVTIHNGDSKVTVTMEAYRARDIRVPGAHASTIRIEPQRRTGIAEASIVDQPSPRRLVTVPDTSPDAEQFLFQQDNERILIRSFTAPRDMTVRVAGTKPVLIDGSPHAPGSTLNLSAGQHLLRTTGDWAALTDTTSALPAPLPAAPSGTGYTPLTSGEPIEPADHDRLLITGHAFNKGLRGELRSPSATAVSTSGSAQDSAQASDSEQLRLEPRSIDADTQAFLIPAGAGGTFHMSFVADRAYRVGLGLGGALAALTTALCLLIIARGARFQAASFASPTACAPHDSTSTSPAADTTLPASSSTTAASRTLSPTRVAHSSTSARVLLALLTVAMLALVAGLPGVAAAAAAWAITRWTTLRADYLAGALTLAAGAMLARAPWPTDGYAGDSLLVQLLCVAAITCACLPHRSTR
ncbi:alpha-(1-_3)-arabinofuranosyltransferase family protein [uncultured Corynebacterium sp.]|uniref:alpha-(1->3)-arabinofuranosyltransferase domain-containing protein n=1 Tax=uncultured Corynebacterium sp. TaxID=159447 RepID=UPI0025D3BAFC|nr:alpha-(1->3)-arabinofuranosyltransferase family protein [uncultured Corynebacterium sp.]